MTNLSVNFCGVNFKNPVVSVSGTFNFGLEYGMYFDLNQLGGITVKGLTLKPRLGNPPPRIAETPCGILNSIGLQNPGVEAFLKNELPMIRKYNTNIIANIAGNTIEEYCEMAKILSESGVDLIEMNISCPNVKEGGVHFGTDPKMVAKITSKVKKYCKKPLIVKLSPNVSDIKAIAKAAEENGADALSLINTILGMRIDINTKRPILRNNVGGLSGPAIKPVAVRMVYEAKQSVSIPIIGMGGIMCGDDAVEFMLAGAPLVGVGTASFINPTACVDVIDGIKKYMEKHNINDVNSLTGGVIAY